MMTKHDKKVMQWLSRSYISDLQIKKMRPAVRKDVVRMIKLTDWRREEDLNGNEDAIFVSPTVLLG